MKAKNEQNTSCRLPARIWRDSAFGAAVAHLPALLRWIMILRGRDGLSIQEVADLAGVSRRAINSLQDRGQILVEQEFLTRA